ncbi:hypothetical protein [Neobacillus drentensis]
MSFINSLIGKEVSKASSCCGVEIKEVEKTEEESCCGTSQANPSCC